MVKFTGETQGTYYAITYFDNDARNFQSQIDSILKVFDKSVSLWEPNSVISQINNENEFVEPDEIFIALFKMSEDVYKKSGGSFDPTVGPLVNAWGFGFTDREKVDQHIVDSLLLFVGFDKVRFENNKIIKSDPRIQFDFNAIAQGYAVDLIGKFLEKKGISDFLIDIGGEVLSKGGKPVGEKWKVGIEKPKDNASYGEGLQAIVYLENRALSTSGNYRKFYEENGIRYSHTIDPKTGYPVRHTLLSVSVLANTCAIADAYATVFMVLGLEKSRSFLSARNDLEGYFIFTDDNGNLSTYFTDGFEKILVEKSE
jgi:thiamine biosynthesis lipoprotein